MKKTSKYVVLRDLSIVAIILITLGLVRGSEEVDQRTQRSMLIQRLMN